MGLTQPTRGGLGKGLLLDTNIYSELLKVNVNQHVEHMFAANLHRIYLATPVWHELRYGFLKMPESRRKETIGVFLHETLSQLPILTYDHTASECHAQLRHVLERQGYHCPFVDGQIASIALSNDVTLVTRNVADFQRIEGLSFINWFEPDRSS